MDYLSRIECIRTEMGNRGLGAVLVTMPNHVRYLTGFGGWSASVVIDGADVTILTDGGYLERALSSFPGVKAIGVSRKYSVYDFLASLNVKSLGVEFEHLTLSMKDQIENKIGNIELTDFTPFIKSMRNVKSPDEVEKIRVSCHMSDDVMAYVAEFMTAGITEAEVYDRILKKLYALGAETFAFPPIVVSGPRGYLLHGVPSDRKLASGDLVVVDLGCVVDGYYSDITRTFAISNISDEQMGIYDIVLKAQLSAMDTIRPGVPCKQVDTVARDYITKAGYGQNFIHSLGHGVGIGMGETIIIGQEAPDNMILEKGMVITNEPGIYIEDKLGVRIEDTVAVTETGCDILHRFTKELIIL